LEHGEQGATTTIAPTPAAMVGWTRSNATVTVQYMLAVGWPLCWKVVGMSGDPRGTICSAGAGASENAGVGVGGAITLQLEDSPVYLLPVPPHLMPSARAGC
jgi:hypothetical protein